jgi:hypothetical protein
MFEGWSADALFATDEAFPPGRSDQKPRAAVAQRAERADSALLDMAGVYASRSDFAAKNSLEELLAGCRLLRASGVSLNLLCQHYPDKHMRELVRRGLHIRLLYLDPDSEAMRLREKEERYTPGYLTGLTAMNIDIVRDRVLGQLPEEARDRVQLAVSDDVVRFNMMLFDETVGVIQPYLPVVRGVDSPTLVLRPELASPGLFETLAQVFDSLWKRARRL